MGSAAAASLAERGLRVVAFDHFTPPHTRGSSHGRSRIFRQAYWEDPRYVHLLLRARELWNKLERDTETKLLHVTGALMIGPGDGQLVARSAEAARQFNLPHEMLSAAELSRRWPVFRVASDSVALLEHNAGYLIPELCIEKQLLRAARTGADLHFDEPVLEWTSSLQGAITVHTPRGRYSAGHLVITAGPWAPQALSEMQLPLQVTRQVLYWFAPNEKPELFREGNLPIYLIETWAAPRILYGFPLIGPDTEGVKIAVHGSSDVCTPETVRRAILPEDEQSIRDRLEHAMPSLAGRLVRAETCLYTMTPDENFVLGTHPHAPAVTIAAGFSGHGFKFAPLIGEILADLAATGQSRHDLTMFSPARFAKTAG